MTPIEPVHKASAVERTPREWIEFYQKQGLNLFYFARTGDPQTDWKKADGVSWNRRDLEQDWSKYDPDRHNVGTLTGSEVKSGRFLVDVDIDWYPPRELLALLPASDFVFGRAGKKLSHLFFTTPERLPSVKEYKDIDGKKFMEVFGGDQQQYTMVPPSLRAPDMPLVPVRNTGFTHIEVDDLYQALRNYALAVLLVRHFGKGAIVHDVRLPLAGFLLKSGLPEEDADAIGRAVTMATGNDISDWATALKTTVARIKSGDKVQGRTKLAEALGDVGKRVVAQMTKFIGGSEFVVNEHGKVLADSSENIRIALEKLDVRLFKDEFAEQLLFQRNGSAPVPLDDDIRIPLRFRIEEAFRFRPQNELYKEVLVDEALKNKVHPVTEYLDGLKWDGQQRIDDWLFTYGHAQADTDLKRRYVRSVGAKHLIAAVRRIRQPGCKKDEMLVLESPQGKAKSSAIQALCPNPDWFSDSLPLGVDPQKVIEQTGGKWIIEAAELHGNRGKEVEAIKVFLSRAVDGPVRRAYAHFPTYRRRQFVLFGTTNKAAYLKDDTGNRRFWPVKVDEFDLDRLVEDRDQLWAEAAYREAQGESIRLERELWEVAAMEQEERHPTDPWEERLVDYFDFDSGNALLADSIWKALDSVFANQRDTRHAERIDAIMRRLGFVRKEQRVRVPYGMDASGNTARKQKTVWLKAEVWQEGQVLYEQLKLIDGESLVSPLDDTRKPGGM